MLAAGRRQDQNDFECIRGARRAGKQRCTHAWAREHVKSTSRFLPGTGPLDVVLSFPKALPSPSGQCREQPTGVDGGFKLSVGRLIHREIDHEGKVVYTFTSNLQGPDKNRGETSHIPAMDLRAKRARRQSGRGRIDAAEIRRIVKAKRIGDLRDRHWCRRDFAAPRGSSD